MAWYYAGSESKPVGPISVEELHRLRVIGTVTADTYIIEHTGQPGGILAWKHYHEVFPTNLPPVHPPPAPLAAAITPAFPPNPTAPAGHHPLFPSAGAVPSAPLHPPVGPAVSPSPYEIKPTNGLCAWGFALSVAGFLLAFVCGIGLIPAIAALFLCVIGLVQVHKNPKQSGQGIAIAGLILAAVALLISFTLILVAAIPMIKAHEQTTTEQTSNDSE